MMNFPFLLRALSTAASVWIAAQVCGCKGTQEFFRPTRAPDQRAAGSVHVAVLAVAPWSRYEAALQPDFRLDADEALQHVLRDTASGAESRNRTAGLSAGVTERPEDNGILSAPSTDSRNSSWLSGPTVSRSDAMLEYQAATSLYQEVQLLNRSVGDAAIPSGYRPYLVRLQVSLLPHRRNEPYDAYTTLSFFAPTEAKVAGASELRMAPPATSLRDVQVTRSELLPGNGPCVLPLIATDNLEGSLQSRAAQESTNLALAMLSFPGNFASEARAELFQSQLQAQLQARDINSLLTVARLSENSLRVRLGAQQQATAKYAMVPRNHFVTLLLMVPEDAPPVVDLVARTVLVDTETGVELEASSEERVARIFGEVRQRLGRKALDDGVLRELFQCVQKNDQESYNARLAKVDPDPVLAHELWLELVQLAVGSQFASFRFELPGHGAWEILPDEFYTQTALLIDDGQQSTRATLVGATFTERVQLSGFLHLEVDGREVSLPAEGLERSERELTLSFPSLAALGLADAARAGTHLTLSWTADKTRLEALYVRRGVHPLPGND